MSRDLRLYLTDILSSIQKIQDYTAGMNYDDLIEDNKTFDADELSLFFHPIFHSDVES